MGRSASTGLIVAVAKSEMGIGKEVLGVAGKGWLLLLIFTFAIYPLVLAVLSFGFIVLAFVDVLTFGLLAPLIDPLMEVLGHIFGFLIPRD